MQFKKLMGNNEKTFTIPDALQLLARKKKNSKLEEEEEGLNSLLSFFFLEKKNVGINLVYFVQFCVSIWHVQK